jgi:uncharacterized protein YbjT (DUF2867 family)
MKLLILGASGLIGSAVAAALAADGHAVTAIARDVAPAARRLPSATWRSLDIARLSTPERWAPLLEEIDCVVNCAGALQDGARDQVAAVQQVAMLALYEAAKAAGHPLIVQITAQTGGAAADSPFLLTKRRADTALAASGLPFVLLRPAIVVGRNAYGGSALLRALAAVPIVTPFAGPDAPLQFVALDDLVDAVRDAVGGSLPPGSDLDLASDERLRLSQAVALHRAWLGLAPARGVGVPVPIALAVARLADLLGLLGWRSPLRTTAVTIAAAGLDLHRPPAERRLKSLAQTLAAMPAGIQDLWFARLYLLKPVMIGTLALFWALSGVIALLRFDVSRDHLVAAGLAAGAAAAVTALTALADIALGIGVTFRRHASLALKGMVAVSCAYLLAATIAAPHLWADPLGPLVKVLPSVVLALAALAILDER